MNLDTITPLILTYNEAPNLRRTLDALVWARHIVIVDSGSTDETLEIARSFPQVEVMIRAFDTFATQWNFGLDRITTEFVLTLDADYLVSAPLLKEISQINASAYEGWLISFNYCIDGRSLRGTLMPPRLALFKVGSGHYYDDGHTQQLRLSGSMGKLRGSILHDDRKSVSRWLVSQLRYSNDEALKLGQTQMRSLGWTDRLRRLYMGPVLVVPYCLLCKGLLLDGRRGLLYTAQRFIAESLLAFRLLDNAVRGK